MVQAILDGRKTMTRRIVKFPKDFTGEKVFDNSPHGLKYSNSLDTLERIECPYGVVGDQLWVRETFCPTGTNEYLNQETNLPFFYRADVSNGCELMVADNMKDYGWKWKPSIHMPRVASRITLRITHIRVELLQTISINDVEKEGIKPGVMMFIEFSNLWEKINGIGSWQKPTWVWVIEFERVQA